MGGKKWRRAVRLFVAAGLLGGVVRPAVAQSGATAPRPAGAPAAAASPTVGILWAEPDDPSPPGLDLAAPAQPPVPPPQPSASPTAARLDLLAVPTVPVRWSSPAPAPLPQGPPRAAPTKPAPLPLQAAAPAPVVVPTASPRPLPGALPPIYPAHTWPPAHSVPPGPGSVRLAHAEDLRAPPPPPSVGPPVPQIPTITDGRILLEDAAPAAAPAAASLRPIAPAVVPAAAPPRRAAPAVAAVPTTPRPAAPAIAPAPPPVQPAAPPGDSPLTGAWPLKRRIKAVCGDRVQDVEVTSRGDWGQLVKVRVANPAVQQEVTARLMTIYELSSPRVRVEVEVIGQ